jgi:hypothetical protein
VTLSAADANAVVEAHNRYRRDVKVNVPDLAWSDALATDAQKWADHLASLPTWPANPHSGVGGENIAWAAPPGSKTPAQFVDQWGAEKATFIPPCTFTAKVQGDPCSTTGDWRHIGHYTQIVWRLTTHVGCGLATSVATGRDIFVARYAPPGNVRNQLVY